MEEHSAGAAPVSMSGGRDQQRQSTPTSAGFGFTPAQQIMFPGSSVNGQQVVVVTPEVARSLGIVAPSNGGRGTEASMQVHQDTAGDVSVSLLDSEADGMMDPDQFLAVELASGKAEVVVDEDLASLSWLHGKSLFKTAETSGRRGVSLPAASHSGESPTSDYAADSPDPADGGSPRPQVTAAARAVTAGSGSPRPQGRTAVVLEPAPEPAAAPAVRPAKARRVPPHLDYDPKVHVTLKPPFSFSCLIFMSIEDSPNRGRPVKDIYRWILESFPFYRDAPIGWKNSVRHNLSLNKCFRKVTKVPSVGKGSLWTVEPEYRASLIQALRRAPCVQQSSSGPRPWTAAANAVPGVVTAARPEAAHKGAAPAAHPARRSAGRGRRGRGAALSPQRLPIVWDPSPAPEPAQRPPAPRVRVVGQDGDVARPATALKSPLPLSPGAKVKTEVKEEESENLPCPQLFPFLSRCLLTGVPGSGSDRAQQVAAPVSEADDNGEEQKLVIVQDPPTPTAVQRADGGRERRRDYDHDYGLSNGARPHPRLLVISRCPEQEHTYARWPQQRHCPQALDSDDEAFSDDSNLSHEHGQRVPGGSSGGRSVEEGADLLLSLAGVPLLDGRVSDGVTPAGGSGRRLARGPAGPPR